MEKELSLQAARLCTSSRVALRRSAMLSDSKAELEFIIQSA